MNTKLLTFLVVMVINYSASFIVIEDPGLSDYVDYVNYDLVQTNSLQQQNIRDQGGLNISSPEFVGTVFLAALLAFLVIPVIQQNFNNEAVARNIRDDVVHFIVDSITSNKF